MMLIRMGMWCAVAAALFLGSQPAAADDHEEAAFRSIFNGENLDGWRGDSRFWRVEDGHIVAQTTEQQPTPGNTFLIWDQGELDDFELKFRYRIDTPWANAGVQIRSEDLGNYAVRGYQADIATDEWITGILYEEGGRAVVARRGQQVNFTAEGERQETRFASESDLFGEIHGVGEWNDYHVIFRGDTIITRINGQKMHEVTDRSDAARRSGVLAFQLHSGPPMTIRFADVQLKRLPMEDRKKVVFVAGPQSHGYGSHEHRAGCLLLAELLNKHTDNIHATVYTGGWPSDPTAFDNADAIVMFSDGGGGHMALPHLDQLEAVLKRGVGLGAIHYAVEVPKDRGGEQFLRWIGGYFETHWSVNPHWTASLDDFPDHPAARGLEPFDLHDEWYYHMRFVEDRKGITPIFAALPSADSLSRPDGAHSGNPHVREAVLEREEPQTLMWAYERQTMPGRGFGLTGAHFHWNWGHPKFRRATLNAIVWIAGAEVPEGGVETPALTVEQLEAHQDYDQPGNFNRDEIRERLERWQQ